MGWRWGLPVWIRGCVCWVCRWGAGSGTRGAHQWRGSRSVAVPSGRRWWVLCVSSLCPWAQGLVDGSCWSMVLSGRRVWPRCRVAAWRRGLGAGVSIGCGLSAKCCILKRFCKLPHCPPTKVALVVEVACGDVAVVGYLHVGETSTVSGDVSIHPLNCCRVEVFAGQKGRHGDLGGGETLGGLFCQPANESSNSFLLNSQVIGACV